MSTPEAFPPVQGPQVPTSCCRMPGTEKDIPLSTMIPVQALPGRKPQTLPRAASDVPALGFHILSFFQGFYSWFFNTITKEKGALNFLSHGPHLLRVGQVSFLTDLGLGPESSVPQPPLPAPGRPLQPSPGKRMFPVGEMGTGGCPQPIFLWLQFSGKRLFHRLVKMLL